MYRASLFLALFLPSVLSGQSTRPASGLTPPPEASQFDYLIGEWRFVATTRNPSGPTHFGGIWRAWKAFDGWGVEDEYRIVDTSGTTRYLGHTVRMYQPESRSWSLTYFVIGRGEVHQQYAVRGDDGMHLWWEAEDARGPFLSRVRYFDITPTSFRWQQDRSYDGGRTWIDGAITIEATRTAESAAR